MRELLGVRCVSGQREEACRACHSAFSIAGVEFSVIAEAVARGSVRMLHGYLNADVILKLGEAELRDHTTQ